MPKISRPVDRIINAIGDKLENGDARALIRDITADGKITKADATSVLARGVPVFLEWAARRDWPRVEAWFEKRAEKWNARPNVQKRKKRRAARRSA